MSTAQRLQQDYLTCTLCSQPFKQPKTLPCLHNFCKQCLSAHLENVMSGGRHSTFNCPDCKKKIYVPDPSKAVNRWAAQFPTNFTLSGMIEAIAQERSGQGQGVAMVKAARERRGVPDLHDQVDQSHRGSPQPSRGYMKKSGSGDSTSGILINDTQARLSMLTSNLKRDCQDIENSKATMQKDLQDQKDKMSKSFQRVIDLVQSREEQLIQELDENFTEELERLEQADQSYKNDLESATSCLELISGIESRPVSEAVVNEMLEAIQAQTKEIEARPPKVITRNVKFEQTLEAGRSILKLVEDLGQVTISTAGEKIMDSGRKGTHPSLTFDQGEARGGGRILAKPKFLNAVQMKGDDGKCHQVYDIAVMQNGTIVMTAYEENLIYAAKKWGNGYTITSRLQLDSVPKCLASISQYYAGVVGTSCVYIIAVDDKLTLKKTVHTGKDYYGIAAYSETSLILASQKPPSIDFVDLNGFISETIDRDHTTGTLLLKCPQFISTSMDGVIYVTDASKVPRVLSVNNAGKINFQYPTDGSRLLEAPQGVCCDSQGHVYVVDRGACKVILLSVSGEKVKDILTKDDGMTDPCAISIDKDDNLYVTNDFKEILIFQIK